MPTVNIDSNIQELSKKIEQLTHELFRLQGVLQTFEGFQSRGLKNIDLPNPPRETPVGDIEELESIQEKPQ